MAALGILPAQAQTASEIVLYNFLVAPKGANTHAGVIRDSAGNLYGTTQHGGTGFGVVYKHEPANRHHFAHLLRDNLPRGVGPRAETDPTSGKVGAFIGVLGKIRWARPNAENINRENEHEQQTIATETND
jgi:uncharacterized repeat protein (TIGR03803 family)